MSTQVTSLRRKNLRRRSMRSQPMIHWQVLLGFMLTFSPFVGWVFYTHLEQITAFFDANQT